MPVMPNRIHFQWYGSDISSERLQHGLKVAKDNPDFEKIIWAANPASITRALSKDITRLDIETTPEQVLSVHGISLRNIDAIYASDWPTPQPITGFVNENADYGNIQKTRRNVDTIQKNEGVGVYPNYAAKKDLNQLAILYKEGGAVVDWDLDTRADDNGKNSFPTDYNIPTGVGIIARYAYPVETYSPTEPVRPNHKAYTENVPMPFLHNNDIMFGSSRSPLTLKFLQAAVEVYRQKSDNEFGTTRSGQSILIHQGKRKPTFADRDTQIQSILRAQRYLNINGIDIDARWRGTLEAAGNRLIGSVLAKEYPGNGEANNKPKAFIALPDAIIPATMGNEDGKWSVIPKELLVSVSLDNPSKAEKNIIKPLSSKL